MALRTPPSWLQQASHPAENDRLTMQALIATSGVVGTSALAVTANGTPNMSVNVAAGHGAVVGDYQSNMGVYIGFNDATTNLTVTAANASLPRIDRVVMTVSDAYYTGLSNTVAFQVIAGTPNASPVAPSTPSMSISLATIAVAAAATTIVSGNITDTRVQVTTNLPVGDITSVVAGSGLSGGGTSGDVTLSIATSPTITTPSLVRPLLTSPQEISTVSATAATGTIQFDVATQADLYYTTNASANFTLNVRGNSGTTLTSILAVGSSQTIVFRNTNGATAYYMTALTIDGSAQTIKWQGGTAPSAGNASAVDVYSFVITKTAATPTYTVLGSITKFA